jgi:hypothetical protein
MVPQPSPELVDLAKGVGVAKNLVISESRKAFLRPNEDR